MRRKLMFSLFVAALAASTGCVKSYQVVEAPQSDGSTYVVVQFKNGGMKLWDCRSTPDGQTWDPTCVKVRMQNSARGEAQSQDSLMNHDDAK